VEIRNSIHKICSVMRSPQCVLPVNELTCYGFADEIDGISEELKQNGKIRERTLDAGSGGMISVDFGSHH
ncbi:hypothetical protein, partial [Escherichia coli]|uniref:hypothetical protein n=1 Tax=Escherichia coli TaxID=562 RepID=UPI00057075D6